MGLRYCEKCGRIVYIPPEIKTLHSCDFCKYPTTPVPEKYINKTDERLLIGNDLKTRQFIREILVKNSFNYDPGLFAKREEDFEEYQSDSAVDRLIELYKQRKEIPQRTEEFHIKSEQAAKKCEQHDNIATQNDAYEQNCVESTEAVWTPTVKCPYCNSLDTKKIGDFSRAMSVSWFGLASNKIGKQWHCNDCGSNF